MRLVFGTAGVELRPLKDGAPLELRCRFVAPSQARAEEKLKRDLTTWFRHNMATRRASGYFTPAVLEALETMNDSREVFDLGFTLCDDVLFETFERRLHSYVNAKVPLYCLGMASSTDVDFLGCEWIFDDLEDLLAEPDVEPGVSLNPGVEPAKPARPAAEEDAPRLARSEPSTRRGRFKRCAQCNSTKTTQWRRGPGDRRLCNACGVRLKKSAAEAQRVGVRAEPPVSRI